MTNVMGDYGVGMMDGGFSDPLWFFAFIAWIIVWKGWALWHAARREESLWFIVLLIVNTAGILEIIYLFFVAKKKLSDLFPLGKID